MKKLAIAIPVLFFSLWALTACFMNDNASTASINDSNNRLVAEQARNERLQAQAEADAAAKIAVAEQNTQQQLYAQNGASERLYAQSQYLTAVNAQNQQATMIGLLVVAALIVFGVIVGVWIYVRENPRPVPWGYPQYGQIGTMPRQIAAHPNTIRAGWLVDWDYGVATHPQKGTVLLEDKEL